MAVAYSARAYQDTTADTADQNQTLVLLFEGAVRFLARALQAMRHKDYEAQCESIVRVQRIFSTLMCSLDRTAAPELADNLWSTNDWIHASLTEASLRDNEELLQQVLEVVSELCEAWRQARRSLTQ
jgi:flagellar protein FliS